MTKRCALVLLALAGGSAFAGDAGRSRVYSPFEMRDMEALAPELKRRVAYLDVRTDPPAGEPLYERERSGFGVAIERDLVAVLAFTVERAKAVLVHGPSGKAVRGEVALYDAERRVALVRTAEPLAKVGLEPPAIARAGDRREGMDVFSLVSTDEHAGVVHGTLTDLGLEPEYEGHPRIDLRLERGMPVFDARARLVGYARAVAWDTDRFMLITPEMIAAARTSTGSAARERSPRAPERPWWAR